MYLVMTPNKPNSVIKEEICKLLKAEHAQESYDGESTATIKNNLKQENNESVLITADSRLLTFVNDYFLIENVYIFNEKQLRPISETTIRILRPAHNLMKMYEAGSFH